ncbi:MAG: dienelactone hydrolase family protein [Thermoanaerobaculia bacterium]|nr:dienelactone hydrolase family protein [Thermoanaerobaculia bacterium]
MSAAGEPGVEVETIAAQVHGRYLVSRPETEPEALLLGFHGFGELADTSMAALQQLAKGRPWVLAAIQGLHPFYRRNGEIVAGWMTSLDRELAIGDNIAYVGSVATELLGRFPSATRIGCVGFSQGVAMAYRAAAGMGFPCQALLSMAGDVPPELRGGERPLPPVLLARGSDDSWYSEDKVQKDRTDLEAQGVAVELCLYEGGHEWTEEVFEAGSRFLVRHLGSK